MRKFVWLIALFLVSCQYSSRTGQKSSIPTHFKPDLSYHPNQKTWSIDTFFTHLHEKRAFNGCVLVANGGKIIYKKAFGYANFLKKDSLKLDSKFQLASVSKQFTAMAILILQEKGKLKISEPVKDFYPDFPYPKITIHELLCHRSGLPKYEWITERFWKNKKVAMTNQDLMNMLAQLKPSLFSNPNTHFFYNNINYAVLAALVEKCSGKSLAEFLKENVFQKIGMHNTLIYSKAVDSIYPTNLIGYEKTFRIRDDPNWMDGIVGDKGVFSTVEDLFIWDQMLYTSEMVSSSSLQEAFKSKNKEIKGHFNYGYGWRIFHPNSLKDSLAREKGPKIVYHTGWWHGYKNLLVRDLEHHNTIIILSNIFNPSMDNLDPLYKILGIPPVRQGAYDSE